METVKDDGVAELRRLADEIFAACVGLPYKDVVAVLSKAQGPLIPIVKVEK